MPVLRNTPKMGGQSKKTTQSEDAQAVVVQPTDNTAQAKEQLTPADAGTAQPSTSGTQPNDQIAQMFQMMQKTFDEQLKFQRDQQQFQKEQQRCPDLQLPPLEKIPVIDWTHNDGLHSQYTIWKEQWNAILHYTLYTIWKEQWNAIFKYINCTGTFNTLHFNTVNTLFGKTSGMLSSST